MTTFTVIAIDQNGDSHNLSSGTTCNTAYLDGTGIPDITRNLEINQNSIGAIDRGFYISPRIMSLHLFFPEDSNASDKRDDIADLFAPSPLPITLRVTRPDSDVKEIDVFLNGELDFSHSGRLLSGRQDVIIPLISPDPIWRGTSDIDLTRDLSSGTSAGVYPDTTGMTWYDWPILEIDGPLTNFQVSNLTSGGVLYFPVTIPDGETYTIDTRPGYKSITDSNGDSVIGSLNAGSNLDLFENFIIANYKWLIGHTSSTNGTDNSLSMSWSGGGANSEFRISYRKRYISL